MCKSQNFSQLFKKIIFFLAELAAAQNNFPLTAAATTMMHEKTSSEPGPRVRKDVSAIYEETGSVQYLQIFFQTSSAPGPSGPYILSFGKTFPLIKQKGFIIGETNQFS